MILTTLSIAASAAFFSVFGLMHLFTGAAIPIMIMGTALEAGKLVAASFLYRFWKNTSFFIKTYLLAAIFILMTITSIGIFGYLTAAYQKDSIPIKELTQKIESNKNELDRLTERKKEIDKQIANLPNNYVNSRQRLMNSFKPELESINPKITELTKSLEEMQSSKLNTEAHIGPIIFVAKALNREPDNAVFYFTLLIMTVFDPLAIVLTVATNMAIKSRKDEKQRNKLEQEVTESIQESIHESIHENDQVIDSIEKNEKESIQESIQSNPQESVQETVDVEAKIKDILDSEMSSHKKRQELISSVRN